MKNRTTKLASFAAGVLHLLFLSLLVSTALFGQNPQYKRFTAEQTRMIVGTNRSQVISLSGVWQRSTKGESTFNLGLPFSEKNEGVYTYRQVVNLEQSQIKNYTWELQCLGVNYRAEIQINDQYLGNHSGGTIPFKIRCNDGVLRAGANTIQITVDSKLNATSTIPLRREPYGAKSSGGIFREAFLVGHPHIWLNDFSTQTKFRNNYQEADVTINALISSGALERLTGDSLGNKILGGKANITVEAEIRDLAGQTVVARTESSQLELESNRNINSLLRLSVSNPRLWSTETPNLYSVVLRVKRNGQVLDESSTTIGLREVKRAIMDGRPVFFVNGAPFDWKAIDYIEDVYPDNQTLSAEQLERDVQMMKTLGATVVRARHTSVHPYLTYLCDKYGLFLLLEIPVVNVPQAVLKTEIFQATAQNALNEIIASYDRHPSVMAYGLGDGVQENTPAAQKFFEKLSQVARGTSDKLLYRSVPSTTKQFDTKTADFFCANINDGDFLKFQSEAKRLHDALPSIPLVVSFGKVIQIDNHNGYSDPLSVEAQAKFVRDRIVFLQESKLACGVIVWSFNDYETDRPILVKNDHSGRFDVTAGLVSRTREARLTYDVVKALFNQDKELVINAGIYHEDDPVIYTILSILFVITFFVLVRNNRRFRENVGRALLRPYNFYADIRDQRILSNVRTIILAFILAGTNALMLSSLLYHLRQSYGLEYFLTYLLPSDALHGLVNSVVWMPFVSTLFFTMMFMMLYLIVGMFVRLGSMFVRSRIYFSDSFIISVWAGLPVIFLLILTMGLYKLLDLGVGVSLAIAIIIGVQFWFLYRVLRGATVIYDISARKVYGIGIAFFCFLIVAVYMIGDLQYSTGAFLQYFFSVVV